MKNMIKACIEYTVLFLLFASIYFVIETVWKHQLTDYRMFILGGVLGVIIGLFNNIFTFETDLFLQGYTGMVTVCLVEAVMGYHWNVIHGFGIWDYSELPLSFVEGQVNLFFAVAWFFLSIVCVFIDDFVWYRFFNREKPYYKLFGKRLDVYR